MRRIGLWQVKDDGPHKLKASGIDLERYLEEWIERDPGLLQQGLCIVGRQIGVEGGQLDLLGLDPQGRWAVIEIKSGRVRRETIAQALDYASCVATLSQEELYRKVGDYLRYRGSSLDELVEERGGLADDQDELRDVVMFVVGAGSEPGLERMIDYLSGVHELPIVLVSYEVFEIVGGQRILVRELTDTETGIPAGRKKWRLTVDDICDQAEQAGIGNEFRVILEAAERHGLYPRPYRRSVMYTPPSNRTRMLFTVWASPKADGLLRMYVGPEAFAEFYPVTEQAVASLLGPDGWRHMTAEDVQAFVANLDRLFEGMEREE